MLRRIEVRDYTGDWRGLFRAIPSVAVDHIIHPIATRHEAPWHTLDLRRRPCFYFTEAAWNEFAEASYNELRAALGDDVRIVTASEADPNVVVIDEVQAVKYDLPAAA